MYKELEQLIADFTWQDLENPYEDVQVSTMGSGIAPQMARAFRADRFVKEARAYKGDMNKLGTIDYKAVRLKRPEGDETRFKTRPNMQYVESFEELEGVLYVVNSYTQFSYGKNHSDGADRPLDYDALKLCFKKINHEFKGKKIGLPKIGCGLAGGSWSIVKKLIQGYLYDCDVTVVIYNK